MEWVIVIISVVILLKFFKKISNVASKIKHVVAKAIEDSNNLLRENENRIKEYENRIKEQNAIKREELFKELEELEHIVTCTDLRALLENKNKVDNTSEKEKDFNKLEENNDIKKEISEYIQKIKTIEVPNFEKIRRYCNNLLNDNQADYMQYYLANNGKKLKAIIYDLLERFIEKLNGENITILDWGCNQGIASMLVIDYIREKQLEINVKKILLIDDDTFVLSRAINHLNILKQENTEVIAINNTNITRELKKIEDNISINIFANNLMPLDFKNIDYQISNESYYLCLCEQKDERIDDFYIYCRKKNETKLIAENDKKVGKYSKYEKIFMIRKSIRIDNDKDLVNDIWIDILFIWADKNIIQENTCFPRDKEGLLKEIHLNLRWNRLKNIPIELCNMEKLKILELNNNNLTELPKEIIKLKNLEVLNLNINNLINLPKEIVKLKNLKVLNIKNNKYLELSNEQISWLKELKNNGCNVIYDKYKFNLGD